MKTNLFKLLINGDCYTPKSIGKNDILLACGKICKIAGNLQNKSLLNTEMFDRKGVFDTEIFDCNGKIICPGFIDQHVHITGGGGESGPQSRIPELMAGEIVSAGVTTLVGILGLDGITRSIAALLAKARALQYEGITTYIYSGSYGIPTTTLTGSVLTDIAFIDKVIGVGEIAIADYRSSHPTQQMLKDLAFQARAGGMLGGKAGVMHIHVGDGKKGLGDLIQLLDESDFPISMFVPTHLNRNSRLFGQAAEYLRKGGFIDFTAGEKSETGLSAAYALKKIIKEGLDISKVTLSSDGNGGMPPQKDGSSGICRIIELYNDIKTCILEENISIEVALSFVTSNVARILGLYPQKGSLSEGSDADILVLNKEDLSIDSMFINGELFIKVGNLLKRGKFE
jgi:beta-aspartyl-dipeptidase (metallo-type)